MSNPATFGSWDPEVHLSDDQKKRILSAQKSETTPSYIDTDAFTGIFPGSGKNPYQTSLDTCTCVDFSRRHLPCKHIYRLAMECGLFPGMIKTGSNANIHMPLEDAVAIIENLDDTDQKEIKDFLSLFLQNTTLKFSVLKDEARVLLSCSFFEKVDSSVADELNYFKRNQIISTLSKYKVTGWNSHMTKVDLISWCSENVPNIRDIFPSVTFLRLSPAIKKIRHDLYSYLHRKFDWDYYYGADAVPLRYPAGAKFGDVSLSISIKPGGTHTVISGNPEQCYFPNDKVTELLTLYGHNRCSNGYLPQPCP